MKLGKLMAIIRDVEVEDVVSIVEVLIDEGITYIEVSLSDEEKGLECIEALSKNFEGNILKLGVGTVIDEEQLEKSVKAGAKYIITPGWNKELIKKALDKDLIVYPGVFSPGEIAEAIAMKIEYLKLFPINSLNESYLKALRGPFPNAKFIGVGGITVDNIEYYQKLGVFHFGIGSDLVPRGATKNDLNKIKQNAREFMKVIEKNGDN